MTIRTILVAASGGSASGGAVDLGCRLARQFDAHLEGFHVRTDARDILVASGAALGTAFTEDLIGQITDEATALAAKTKAQFDAAALHHGLPPAAAGTSRAAAVWREEVGYAPSLVARRARFFDLIVLGRSARIVDEPYSDAIEETLVASGRPLLVAPATPPATLGERVALGWNGSPEAVRAMAGALPILAAAKTVSIMTVGAQHRTSGATAAEYLGRHGITATPRPLDPTAGMSTGARLLATARDDQADLLVIGAYGRKPWREALFGGATRDILDGSLLPLLLSQ